MTTETRCEIDTAKVRTGLDLAVTGHPFGTGSDVAGHLVDLAHDLCDEIDRLRGYRNRAVRAERKAAAANKAAIRLGGELEAMKRVLAGLVFSNKKVEDWGQPTRWKIEILRIIGRGWQVTDMQSRLRRLEREVPKELTRAQALQVQKLRAAAWDRGLAEGKTWSEGLTRHNPWAGGEE